MPQTTWSEKLLSLKTAHATLPACSCQVGIPVFSLRGFEGILNSTTNIILTEMETKQCTFDEALKKAQDEGIAERDPSGDIDGHDAATKVAVLAAVVLGAEVR